MGYPQGARSSWCFACYERSDNNTPFQADRIETDVASVALAQGCLGSSPRGQVGLGFQSPRFSGSLVFSLPPRLSGSLRLTAPGCTLIPLGS